MLFCSGEKKAISSIRGFTFAGDALLPETIFRSGKSVANSALKRTAFPSVRPSLPRLGHPHLLSSNP